ncbi:MAG: TonB C-terminal domain-containing protein, partial [Deltaproteobacteria bacterium]|nr:TonB C-terminal domain-containing protein [Deltaproteobacteria bacterium]
EKIERKVEKIEKERETIVQRPLPGLRELLPSVTAPSLGAIENRTGAIGLNTTEPQYVTYFSSIKRAIEREWDYPEPALRSRLQGKLVVEFTVLWNGELEKIRLLRSSGFSILDEEAVRAVQAAAPFHPIPSWIGKSRLPIEATFIYHDNRQKYGLRP